MMFTLKSRRKLFKMQCASAHVYQNLMILETHKKDWKVWLRLADIKVNKVNFSYITYRTVC